MPSRKLIIQAVSIPLLIAGTSFGVGSYAAAEEIVDENYEIQEVLVDDSNDNIEGTMNNENSFVQQDEGVENIDSVGVDREDMKSTDNEYIENDNLETPELDSTLSAETQAITSIKTGWYPIDKNGVRISESYTMNYTGGYLNPVDAISNGTLIVKRPSYAPFMKKNKELGRAVILFKGMKNYGYKDYFRAHFTIVPNGSSTSFNIANASVSSVSAKTYTGTAIKPEIKVTHNGKQLEEKKDYQLTYSNNIQPGTATITIKGKGSYSGTKTVNFKISAGGFSSATISSIKNQTYTGKAIEPSLSVKIDKKTLSRNRDYTVQYSNNVNVGTAKATITGKGGYSGSTSTTFKIVAASISSASAEKIPDQAWTGKALKPAPVLTKNGITLKSGSDYTLSYKDNTQAGTATITVTGKGNWTGTKSISFKILQKAFDSAKIAAIKEQTYTGAAIKPTVKVTLGSTTLKSGTDYTVSYSNNTKVGTAKVIVTGKGNYSAVKKEATFKIVKANVSKATVGTIKAQKYTGKAITPTITVKMGSRTLIKGTDYTVAYKNNVKVGTATVTITGKGNYTGTKSVTFKITK